jgi:hypothetical protein
MRTTGVVLRWMLMAIVLTPMAVSYGQQVEGKDKPADTGQSASAQSQPAQEGRNFQLTFTARELDENGKVVNTRRFDTMVTADSPKEGGMSSIRSGERIPVPTGPNGQFQYADVGANFDVNRAHIVKGNHLAMMVTAEINRPDTTGDFAKATIRQNRWTGDVEIPIGGRKVIFSSDDLSSKRTLQIELAVVAVER